MSPALRLLPHSTSDGPHHMAADEVLLEAAVAGTASFRLYGWLEATLSLGYFQPERLRVTDARLAVLPFVRRPSGGDALVHHHELTYALALPADRKWRSDEPWPRRLHRILAVALAEFGVAARLHICADEPSVAGVLCFQHFTPCDLLVGPAKVAGSAQRRQRGALLQHGGILLATSPHTPALPGIRELTGRSLTAADFGAVLTRVFAQETGWDLTPGDWTAEERQRKAALLATKYAQDGWNRKR